MGSIREIPLLVALAVKGGFNPRTPLRAITLTAAEVLGVADRIRSIDVGKNADLIILNGDTFHYRTSVERVLIEGKIVYPLR